MRTKKSTSYEEEMKIDADRLDIELIEQPILFAKYSRYSAQANKKLDRAKEHLKVVEAECAKDVRIHPRKFNIEKITESAVREAVLTHPDYNEANIEYIDAKHDAEIMQSAVFAIHQRKASLENLVKLLSMEYFAGPKQPRDLQKELKRRKEEARDKLMPRRKRRDR